jgi:anti-anti-sigma factor
MSMQTEIAVLPTCVLLSVKGGFRHADRAEFAAAIDRALHPGCTRVLLDLREVHFIDSAALSVLAMTHQQLKRRQVEFGLLKPTAQVLRLLTISGIPNIIPIYRTELERSTPNAA